MEQQLIPEPTIVSSTQSGVLEGPMVLLKKAYEQYRMYFHKTSPLLVIAFAVTAFQTIIRFTSHGSSLLNVIGTFLALILSYVSYLAFIVFVTHPKDQELTISDLYFKAWNMFFSYLWIMILVSLTVFGGMVLFIIPAFIIAIFLSFSIYTFVAENQKGMNALTQSVYYVSGNWWKILGRLSVLLVLLLIIVAIFSFLVFVLGLSSVGPHMVIPAIGNHPETVVYLIPTLLNDALNVFVITPFAIIYYFLVYTAIKHSKYTVLTEGNQKKVRNSIYVFIALGIIAAFLIAIYFASLFGFLFGSSQHLEGVKGIITNV